MKCLPTISIQQRPADMVALIKRDEVNSRHFAFSSSAPPEFVQRTEF